MMCLIGVILGTMVGVLPGLGPIEAMAIMLPLSIRFGPLAGLILLAGVWYGAQYGGSTTSILVNIPGEASSVITCIDGYQMTRKGRAGAALGCFGHRVLCCRHLWDYHLAAICPTSVQGRSLFRPSGVPGHHVISLCGPFDAQW